MSKGAKGFVSVLCSAMLLLASLDASAVRYYKSIDENGNVVFSDRPASSDAEQIDVQVFTPDLPAPAAPATKKTEDAAAAEAEQAAEEDLKALQATRDENCKKAKNRLKQLQTISRLYSEDEKGSRTYVSDDDRAKQLADTRTLIKEWCK